MPVFSNLSRLVALSLVLCCFCQCESMRRFAPQSPSADEKEAGETPEKTKKPKDKKPKDKKPTKEEEAKDYRLVAVNNTPFFPRLRSGLRSEAKPKRFLDKGARVVLLEEDEESKFSRIQLSDKKKGWVPSRLVKEKAPEEETSVESREEPEAGTDGGEPDAVVDEPETPEQPNEATTDLGPLDDNDLPPIAVPDHGITMPRAVTPQPKHPEKEPEDKPKE